MAAASLRNKIMLAIVANLEALKDYSDSYFYQVSAVQRRQTGLPENPTTPCIYVYAGDEEKDDGQEFGKLRCQIPVVVRYRMEWQDKDAHGTVADNILADLTLAMGTQESILDADSMPVRAQISEDSSMVHVEAPSGTLLDVLVRFNVVYSHAVGDQTRG